MITKWNAVLLLVALLFAFAGTAGAYWGEREPGCISFVPLVM